MENSFKKKTTILIRKIKQSVVIDIKNKTKFDGGMMNFSFWILIIGIAFITFVFVRYVLWQEEKDYMHEAKTTYESYHKKVCIDCLEEFPTEDI